MDDGIWNWIFLIYFLCPRRPLLSVAPLPSQRWLAIWTAWNKVSVEINELSNDEPVITWEPESSELAFFDPSINLWDPTNPKEKIYLYCTSDFRHGRMEFVFSITSSPAAIGSDDRWRIAVGLTTSRAFLFFPDVDLLCFFVSTANLNHARHSKPLNNKKNSLILVWF